MCCIEEPVQSLVLGQVEVPQVESPLLARKDPADEHDLDYVDEFELLVHHVLNTCLESVSSLELPQDRPFSCQEVSHVGMLDRNSGAATHSGSRGSVM